MWDAFVAWFQSPAGQRVIDTAVIPAVAILVAGVLAALIARAAIRSLLARADREAVTSSVAGLVETVRAAGVGEVDDIERARIERLRTEADVRLRLSGVPGAALAADWASLRIEAIERDARSAVPQTAAAIDEVRDRLTAWVARPRRAKRLFAADVERLGAERTARRATPTPATAPPPVDASAPGPKRAGQQAAAPVAPARRPAATNTESRHEPVAARAQNLAHELQAERAKAAAGDGAGETRDDADEARPGPTTEPVLIQRTRLDSMDRESPDAHAEHARHARPESTPTIAVTGAGPEPAASSSDRRASEPPTASAERKAPEPEAPAPTEDRQPTPAWLDTYDDEAEVTRDIDLSKTPPPKAASAVRDRTRTGDDIVPRH